MVANALAISADDVERAVKLSEIGPRLTLQLARVQKGVSAGAVMYEREDAKAELAVEDASRKKTEKNGKKPGTKKKKTKWVDDYKCAERPQPRAARDAPSDDFGDDGDAAGTESASRKRKHEGANSLSKKGKGNRFANAKRK